MGGGNHLPTSPDGFSQHAKVIIHSRSRGHGRKERGRDSPDHSHRARATVQLIDPDDRPTVHLAEGWLVRRQWAARLLAAPVSHFENHHSRTSECSGHGELTVAPQVQTCETPEPTKATCLDWNTDGFSREDSFDFISFICS